MLGAFAILATAASSRVHAQSAAVHEHSTPAPGARYEIIESPLVVRSTFRLDRYTGALAVLSLRTDSTLTWDPVPRGAHPKGDPERTGQANYEMFLSGIANRVSLLVNVNNGATWQLVQTSDGGLALEPVD